MASKNQFHSIQLEPFNVINMDYSVADLFAKVNCTYCQEDINGVRVQCCVCPEFDICLQVIIIRCDALNPRFVCVPTEDACQI